MTPPKPTDLDNADVAPDESRRHFAGRVVAQPGKPLQFEKIAEAPSAGEGLHESVVDAIAQTLRLYQRAARDLLGGPYHELADAAPPHMRVPCDTLVMVCDDGIFVRWDKHEGDDKPRIRIGRPQEGPRTVAELAPGFSEQYVHCPMEITGFQLPADGPKMQLAKVNYATGEQTLLSEVQFGLVANWGTIRTEGAKGNRPIPLVSIANEVNIDLVGEEFDATAEPKPGTGQEFVLAGRMRLAVGWEVIEIYPPFDPTVWRPQVAKDWAELDLLAAAARHNLRQQQLNAIDPRAATRREYGHRLDEFRSLLDGPEADLQQFLETNPELLSPSHLRMWKKVPLGRRITDFVFREAGDYLLVEIEAPTRTLFRRDGQQTEELTHAMDQVHDWLRYIEDNPDTVRRELGLEGISSHPQCLIVIGRSASLSDEDKRKLATMQGTLPKFRILTYDDALIAATQAITNLLGSIPNTEGAVEIYYRWPSTKSTDRTESAGGPPS